MFFPEHAPSALPPQAAELRKAVGALRPSSSPWRYLGTLLERTPTTPAPTSLNAFGAGAIGLDRATGLRSPTRARHLACRLVWGDDYWREQGDRHRAEPDPVRPCERMPEHARRTCWRPDLGVRHASGRTVESKLRDTSSDPPAPDAPSRIR
ncbi:hypothetical protein Mext_4881 [Methylorubrum extorquens PA1]|nr:hypothetical protein Mext_4881 [Methylorubrum extorquens PA1]